MNVSIEPIAGVIRVYGDGKSFEGRDEYLWAATVRWVDSKTLEILGVTQPPTLDIRRAIQEYLERDELGLEKVILRRGNRVKTIHKRRSV